MKGLLIKDIALMRAQIRFFIIIFVIGIVMAVSGNDPLFMVGYTSFIIPSFTLSTISYDEFDKGYAFLFTLPITKKQYVLEKYLLAAIFCASALILSTALAAVLYFVKGGFDMLTLLAAAPVIFIAVILIQSIMIPLQLKFGADKSRIIVLVSGGGVFLVGILLAQLTEYFNIDIAGAVAALFKFPTVLAFPIIFALAMLLSIKISMGIMQKKEF